MEIDIDTTLDDLNLDLLSRSLDNKLWNGKLVTIEQAPSFLTETYQNVCTFLLNQEQDWKIHFPRGYNFENSFRFPRSFENLTNELEIQNIGLKKFWKKHKKAIIITAAIITAVVVSTAVGAFVASAVAVDNDKGPPRPKKAPKSANPPKKNTKTIYSHNESKSNDSLTEMSLDQTRPNFKFPINPPNMLNIPEKDLLQYNQEIKRTARELQTYREFWETEKQLKDLYESKKGVVAYTDPLKSMNSVTPGKRDVYIGGINGVFTNFNGAKSHGEYLKKLSGGQAINWVYNKTNGIVSDLVEVMTMNYYGNSPNTAALLTDTWIKFHRDHLDNPNVKYLHFCHSQGAIHTKNALKNCPKEVRDRIIVVAIAPASVVPKKLCHESYNYMSKKDFIPKCEILHACAHDRDEEINVERIREAVDSYQELIILEPHPESKGIDHDFQSPTFRKIIKDVLEDFKKNHTY